MNIEQMLLDDAREAVSARETRVAVELLRPSMAKAAIEAKRLRRQRKEMRVFLLALVPFLAVVFFALNAFFTGRLEQLCALALPIGGLMTGTLLMLPILEKFLPKGHNG